MSAQHRPGINRDERNRRWARLRLTLIGVAFVAALTVLLIFPLLPTDQLSFQVGDVAREDIRAPGPFEYQSQIQTDRERDRAAALVDDVYVPPETIIARQQMARAQEILAYISSVRQDTYRIPNERILLIQAIPDADLHLTLTSGIIRQILAMNDSEWAEVRGEVQQVLGEAMSDRILEDELARARARVPALVNVQQMNDEEVAIVSALVKGLLAANTFVNTAKTEAAREEVKNQVQPVTRTFKAGEIVLREGETVDELDLEALQALGLLQPETGWREAGGVLALVLLTTLVLGGALTRYQPDLLTGRSRNVALVALLFVLFVVLAKLMAGRTILPYLYPAAALSMLVTVLLNPELAILASLTLAGLVGNITGGSLELTTYAAAGGLVAALMLRRVERVNAFFWTGVYVGLTNVVVVLIFRLPDDAIDPVGILSLIGAGLGNGGLAASLALGVFFIVGNLLDITTALKLLELSQPSHPLLRQLLLKAPGTHTHTMLIANLAEEAAERIGANALLTRVGAYYHDIGKTMRPHFFTENQMGGVNPHDRLDPYTSADILMSHVTDGVELAKRHRLPSQVCAFITEHHGDAFVSFMYQRAVEQAGGDAGQVDERLFRYVGPKPQSRETALLMLADTTEALIKSKRPSSVEELQESVNRAIQIRLEQGQLDECDLTLRDLSVIRQSFVDTLKGMYHTRVEYPESKQVGQARPSQVQQVDAPDGRLAQVSPSPQDRERKDREAFRNRD